MTIQSPFLCDLHHFILFYFLKLLPLEILLVMHLVHLLMLYEFILIFLNFMPQNLFFICFMNAKCYQIIMKAIMKAIIIVIIIFFLLPYVCLFFQAQLRSMIDQIYYFINMNLSLVLTTMALLIFIFHLDLEIFPELLVFKNLKLSFLIYLSDLNFNISKCFFLFFNFFLFQMQKFQDLDHLFLVQLSQQIKMDILNQTYLHKSIMNSLLIVSLYQLLLCHRKLFYHLKKFVLLLLLLLHVQVLCYNSKL